MAEIDTDIPNQLIVVKDGNLGTLVDLDKIHQEAKHRWLMPAEIREILTNYQQFELRARPRDKPPAGSLFLFDKKVVKYFRKDGHIWRKSIDGKKREAHEKLKVGGVNVLDCYYAHGETNENLQRRCYWMLDKQLKHIVLVHYRDVKEGCNSDVPSVQNETGTLPQSSQPTTSGTQLQSCESSQQIASGMMLQSCESSQPIASGMMLQSSESSQQTTLPDQAQSTSYLGLLLAPELDDNALNPNPDSSMRTNIHGFEENAADFLSNRLTDATRLDGDISPSEVIFSSGTRSSSLHAGSEGTHTSVMITDNDDDSEGLKKQDCFGSWVNEELVCEYPLMATPDCWSVPETEKDKNQVLSLSQHVQLDTDSIVPTLAAEQLFSILDFAPDRAYSGRETKVIITGTFLSKKECMRSIKWCCMFGDTEVEAEVLTENAIRCQVPMHAAGHVSFYLTRSNRIACSEVREFEFVDKSSRLDSDAGAEDEFALLVRFSKLVSSGIERKWLGCMVENCEKCKLKDVFHSLLIDREECWKRITDLYNGNCKELLIQNLLIDALYGWLLCEAHESCQGLQTLDEKGQGVVHLAAALGYEWAISPIAAAGLSLNFRDACGWTALHWASLYGREETVVTLVKLGASASAVDDPTSTNPSGSTAADWASSKGHIGIAGYLAEADLMSRLSALSLKDKNVGGEEVEIHKGPLAIAKAAVRRSLDAAALIHGSIMDRSFHQKQVGTSSTSNLDPAAEASIGAAAAAAASSSSHMIQKSGHYEDYLHVAASRIQRKYRLWRGRNGFLKFRDRIVKIQALVRGHQARQHYKKVVRCVGIMEKAILRWRRKRRGLRGFRPELTRASRGGIERGEYDHLQIGQQQKHHGVQKALAMVQTMASDPQAQEQYMRMLLRFAKLSHDEESKGEENRDGVGVSMTMG